MAKCKNCKHLKYKDNGRERYAWCPLIGDNPDLEFERYCGAFKKMSNADHIRNMTDEQLAHYLEGFAYGGMKVDANKILKWLKSEVGCE